jgi:hypothetical protein
MRPSRIFPHIETLWIMAGAVRIQDEYGLTLHPGKS